jgi:hypothetical protein
MGKITARLSSHEDQNRLLQMIRNLIGKAHKEANEISGNDPKYRNRVKVLNGLKEIEAILNDPAWEKKV